MMRAVEILARLFAVIAVPDHFLFTQTMNINETRHEKVKR